MPNLVFVVYSRGIDENIMSTLNILRNPIFGLDLNKGVFVVRGFNQESIRDLERMEIQPLVADPEGGAVLRSKRGEEIHFIPSRENAEGPCIGWDTGLSFAFDRFWDGKKTDYVMHLPVDLFYREEDDARDNLHRMKEQVLSGNFDLIIGDYVSGSSKEGIERYIREALFEFLPEFMHYENVDSKIRTRSEFFCIRLDGYEAFRKKRGVLSFELTIQLLIHLVKTHGKLGRVSLGTYHGFGDYPIQKVLHQMHRGSFAIRNEVLQWSDSEWLTANKDLWMEKEMISMRSEIESIRSVLREEKRR